MAAALYLVSYGDRARSRVSRSPPRVGNLGQLRNVVDLSTFFQQNSPNPGIGGPVEFLVGVNENGGQDATDVTLTVQLSPAMKLLGRPYVVQGSCGATAPIRLPARRDPRAARAPTSASASTSTQAARKHCRADATAAQADFNPKDNTSSYTVNLGPGVQAERAARVGRARRADGGKEGR